MALLRCYIGDNAPGTADASRCLAEAPAVVSIRPGACWPRRCGNKPQQAAGRKVPAAAGRGARARRPQKADSEREGGRGRDSGRAGVRPQDERGLRLGTRRRVGHARRGARPPSESAGSSLDDPDGGRASRPRSNRILIQSPPSESAGSAGPPRCSCCAVGCLRKGLCR